MTAKPLDHRCLDIDTLRNPSLWTIWEFSPLTSGTTLKTLWIRKLSFTCVQQDTNVISENLPREVIDYIKLGSTLSPSSPTGCLVFLLANKTRLWSFNGSMPAIEDKPKRKEKTTSPLLVSVCGMCQLLVLAGVLIENEPIFWMSNLSPLHPTLPYPHPTP